MSGGLKTMEAIGLLRSGASPAEAWWEAFGVGVEADGAPAFSLPGAAKSEEDVVEVLALRAAGRLACRAGAPLADVLERIEEAERGRRRTEAAREAALAGPRASATVLMWLPAVGWVFAVALDPRAARILLASPLGWTLLAIGGALWMGGRAWLKRLVSRAEAAGLDAAPAAFPLALAEAAVGAGLDVRAAMEEVGVALGGESGEGLVRASARLAAGDTWTRAWAESPVALEPLERALRSSWLRGASPAPTLSATREAIIELGRLDAEKAAARLSVSATLPLTLCLLPAFVVVGVLPLVVAMASGLRTA
jgi:tight adherence protein B